MCLCCKWKFRANPNPKPVNWPPYQNSVSFKIFHVYQKLEKIKSEQNQSPVKIYEI